jgi:hypothetical protein
MCVPGLPDSMYSFIPKDANFGALMKECKSVLHVFRRYMVFIMPFWNLHTFYGHFVFGGYFGKFFPTVDCCTKKIRQPWIVYLITDQLISVLICQSSTLSHAAIFCKKKQIMKIVFSEIKAESMKRLFCDFVDSHQGDQIGQNFRLLGGCLLF